MYPSVKAGMGMKRITLLKICFRKIYIINGKFEAGNTDTQPQTSHKKNPDIRNTTDKRATGTQPRQRNDTEKLGVSPCSNQFAFINHFTILYKSKL